MEKKLTSTTSRGKKQQQQNEVITVRGIINAAMSSLKDEVLMFMRFNVQRILRLCTEATRKEGFW